MNRQSKYIVFDDGLGEHAVIFPRHIAHATMATMLNHRVVSAGFVAVEVAADGGGVTVQGHGESVSLGLASRPEDGEILRRMLIP